MNVDSPTCNFKYCRYCFDGNCIDTNKYAGCEFSAQKAEIARLNGCVKSEEEVRAIMKSQIESVVKQVAKRLKDTKFKHGNDYIIYADNIDNILKEMGVDQQ